MRALIFYAALSALSLAPVARLSAQNVSPISPEQAALEGRAAAVTPENPIPRRLTRTLPEYPAALVAASVLGTVTLRVFLDESGRVAGAWPGMVPDTHVRADGRPVALAMSSALRVAASEAVKGWTYEPPAQAPLAFFVRLVFSPGAPVSVDWHDERVPPAFTPNVPVTPPTVRVGGAIKLPPKTKHVDPIYPNIARMARIQGRVSVEITIAPDGTVRNARVVSGITTLNEAALEAVLQWQYTPVQVDGVAVTAIATVPVRFALD